jgi:hypothetical protein
VPGHQPLELARGVLDAAVGHVLRREQQPEVDDVGLRLHERVEQQVGLVAIAAGEQPSVDVQDQARLRLELAQQREAGRLDRGERHLAEPLRALARVLLRHDRRPVDAQHAIDLVGDALLERGGAALQARPILLPAREARAAVAAQLHQLELVGDDLLEVVAQRSQELDALEQERRAVLRVGERELQDARGDLGTVAGGERLREPRQHEGAVLRVAELVAAPLLVDQHLGRPLERADALAAVADQPASVARVELHEHVVRGDLSGRLEDRERLLALVRAQALLDGGELRGALAVLVALHAAALAPRLRGRGRLVEAALDRLEDLRRLAVLADLVQAVREQRADRLDLVGLLGRRGDLEQDLGGAPQLVVPAGAQVHVEADASEEGVEVGRELVVGEPLVGELEVLARVEQEFEGAVALGGAVRRDEEPFFDVLPGRRALGGGGVALERVLELFRLAGLQPRLEQLLRLLQRFLREAVLGAAGGEAEVPLAVGEREGGALEVQRGLGVLVAVDQHATETLPDRERVGLELHRELEVLLRRNQAVGEEVAVAAAHQEAVEPLVARRNLRDGLVEVLERALEVALLEADVRPLLVAAGIARHRGERGGCGDQRCSDEHHEQAPQQLSLSPSRHHHSGNSVRARPRKDGPLYAAPRAGSPVGRIGAPRGSDLRSPRSRGAQRPGRRIRREIRSRRWRPAPLRRARAAAGAPRRIGRRRRERR